MTTRRLFFAAIASMFGAVAVPLIPISRKCGWRFPRPSAAAAENDILSEVTALTRPMRVSVAAASGSPGEVVEARKAQILRDGTQRVWLWRDGGFHSYPASAHLEILPDLIEHGGPTAWHRLSVQVPASSSPMPISS